MIKRLLSILLIMVLVVSIVGCSQSPKTSGESTLQKEDATPKKEEKSDEKSEAPKQVKELLLTLPSSWVKDGAEALIDYVNSKSEETGAKIVLDKLPEGEMGEQVLMTRFASGQYPDIIAHHGANVTSIDFGGVENFMDISGEWTSNYSSDILATKQFTIDGKLIAAPFGAINIGGMLYNKKVFSELGLSIPNNWEEFISVCEKIKTAGKVPVYYSGKDAWTLQIIPILGFGRELVGKDQEKVYAEINTNKIKFADQVKFIDSIAKLKELNDLGYVNETYLSDTYDNAQKALVEGEAAMYSMATWVLPDIEKNCGKDAVENIGAFAVPFDGNDPVSAWMPWTLSVPSKGENRELALKVVQLIQSKEAQEIFFNAESSIPLMKGLEVDLLAASQDLYTIFQEEGRGMPEFTGKVLYGQGADFANNLQSTILGEITPNEVANMIDQQREETALTKDDPNWKK